MKTAEYRALTPRCLHPTKFAALVPCYHSLRIGSSRRAGPSAESGERIRLRGAWRTTPLVIAGLFLPAKVRWAGRRSKYIRSWRKRRAGLSNPDARAARASPRKFACSAITFKRTGKLEASLGPAFRHRIRGIGGNFEKNPKNHCFSDQAIGGHRLPNESEVFRSQGSDRRSWTPDRRMEGEKTGAARFNHGFDVQKYGPHSVGKRPESTGGWGRVCLRDEKKSGETMLGRGSFRAMGRA